MKPTRGQWMFIAGYALAVVVCIVITYWQDRQPQYKCVAYEMQRHYNEVTKQMQGAHVCIVREGWAQ